jgi:hypothetical protein
VTLIQCDVLDTGLPETRSNSEGAAVAAPSLSIASLGASVI